MSEAKTQMEHKAPAVGVQRLVRLASPLAGQYCNFDVGTEVKIKESLTGQWTVERAVWRNSLTISNVLYGVPSHALILDEPNASGQAVANPKPQSHGR